VAKKGKGRHKIIFDMDGVITGEECYWNAASLAVWELLFSPLYLGLEPPGELPRFKTALTPAEIASIRKTVFQEDKVIAFVKGHGVNSNWDLAFLTFGYQLILLLKALAEKELESTAWSNDAGDAMELKYLGTLARHALPGGWRPSFDAILSCRAGEVRGVELAGVLASQFPGGDRKRGEQIFTYFSPLWKKVRDIFQEWYLGEEKYSEFYCRKPSVPGKRGLIFDEKPLLPVEKITATLKKLLQKGWILGIATGRPLNELQPPLESMGIWELFDRGSIVTFDDVEKAEGALKAKGKTICLGKPHPFPFLKAYWGRELGTEELIFPAPRKPEPDRCWIVGDSPADLAATREMGGCFIGVLSGHSGIAARPLFEKDGAAAVLPDLTFIPRYLSGVNGPTPKR
jgi:phosphoglycolate phosphatase-like HAD superfamily hydrolase